VAVLVAIVIAIAIAAAGAGSDVGGNTTPDVYDAAEYQRLGDVATAAFRAVGNTDYDCATQATEPPMALEILCTSASGAPTAALMYVDDGDRTTVLEAFSVVVLGGSDSQTTTWSGTDGTGTVVTGTGSAPGVGQFPGLSGNQFTAYYYDGLPSWVCAAYGPDADIAGTAAAELCPASADLEQIELAP
jgi:hypothetical protein